MEEKRRERGENGGTEEKREGGRREEGRENDRGRKFEIQSCTNALARQRYVCSVFVAPVSRLLLVVTQSVV